MEIQLQELIEQIIQTDVVHVTGASAAVAKAMIGELQD